MNESPWRPPTANGPDRPTDRPDTSQEGSAPSLPPSAPPSLPPTLPPSPWSPEGAAASPGERSDESGPSAPGGVAPAPPPGPPATPAPTTLGDAEIAPTPPPRRRSRFAVGGAVAAVVALGVAGLFAVQRWSDGAAGGAATAEQLGHDLLTAVEAEDVLGVIDTLLPGERDSLGDPFVEMVGELQRLEVLSADTDLSRLRGLDVELADEAVAVSGTNVPDIVTVSLAAEGTVTLDGATLPIGGFIAEQLPDDALDDLRSLNETETDRLDLELTAVQEGDRWYFSVFHSIAEQARLDAGGEPIPAEGISPAGGDAPEAAIDRMLDHLERLDLRGILAALDPAEAAALQRYAPLFLPAAEAELAQVALDWRIDVREFRVVGDGDERTVFVDALGFSGEVEGAPFNVVYSDDCVRAEFDGESIEECSSAADEELASLFADAPAIEAFTVSLEEAFSDLEPTGLEVRQRDGEWFVSPLATLTDAVLAMVQALDRSELDRLVEDGTAAVGEFFELFLGEFGADAGFDLADEFDLPADPLGVDGPNDGLNDGLNDGVNDGVATAWDECFAEPLAADAAACFERYVASGALDRVTVPAALLHPECGLTELSWGGGYYGVSDEEFAAALATAVPCFEALVASGELEEWMLPFEVENADCFEGRNWFDEFDDDEYLARVDACLTR